MGGVLQRDQSPGANAGETKLEARIAEAVRIRERKGSSIKSFNTIILKFPKIDESLRKCKSVFEQFDEDGNGTIEPLEMKRCFQKLKIDFSDEDIDELFATCDINEDSGMKFSEFIVLLCLVYLLKDDPAVQHVRSQMGMPDLESTFETLVDAFVFLDNNKDGYVSKNEMVQVINESSTRERSSGGIGLKRFEEMDWDHNGMVNFKEFIFAFTHWVGIEENEDDEDDEDSKDS